jgi:N-acetylglucosaminyldiphosphoundecaprenol N-acetyl-beta-D-mannosaminyltransferase
MEEKREVKNNIILGENESMLIGGVRVDFGVSEEDVLKSIDKYVNDGGSHCIFTVNPEFVMKAKDDAELLEVLNSSDLSVPDGAGILFSRAYLKKVSSMARGPLFPLKFFAAGIWTGISHIFMKNKLGARITGAELIYSICEHASNKGYTVVLAGGWEKDKSGKMKPHHGHIAKKTAKKLKDLYPGLKIAVAVSDVSPEPGRDRMFLQKVKDEMSQKNINSADIVFGAFTSGSQEKWLKRILPGIPAKVGLGVGATFDFVAGTYKRAPNFMKEMHLEWIHRLIKQPWRARRIIRSVIEFPLFIYKQSLKS